MMTVILAGDWNTVLENYLNKQHFLNDVISDYGFSDVFSLCRGDEHVYTHFNKQHKRLDFLSTTI